MDFSAIKDQIASNLDTALAPTYLNEVIAGKMFPAPVTNTPMGVVYAGAATYDVYEDSTLESRTFAIQIFFAPANSVIIPEQVLLSLEDLIQRVVEDLLKHPDLDGLAINCLPTADGGSGRIVYNRKWYYGFEVSVLVRVRIKGGY